MSVAAHGPRPVPHLRVVKAMVEAQGRATSSAGSRVALRLAVALLALGLALVVLAQRERRTDSRARSLPGS